MQYILTDLSVWQMHNSADIKYIKNTFLKF